MTKLLRDIVADARRRLKRQHMRRYLRWVGSAERCKSCAYRAGTEASGDDEDVGLTRLRRALLDAAQPFYCHEPGPLQGKRRLCIGHMNAMTVRFRSGHYDRHPPTAPEVIEELREANRIREAAWALQLAASPEEGE